MSIRLSKAKLPTKQCCIIWTFHLRKSLNFSIRWRSHVTTLPTSLREFPSKGSVPDRSHIPALNMFNSLRRDCPFLPHPVYTSKFCREGHEASGYGVQHMNLPTGIFSRAGQWNWMFHSDHPPDDCSVTSRVKRRSQWRSRVLWKARESQISPLGCSPFVFDEALLAPPQLSLCT